MAGLIVIRDDRSRLWRAARREIKRVGLLRFLDVVAFRAYARLTQAARDAAWKEDQIARVRERYPADLSSIPQITVSSPNSEEARQFLAGLAPDLAIARCKFILKPAIFQIPRVGTFVMHPGICPEYRNAHGCFWALVNRDLDRVGMTLLKVDAGIDTGPMYFHGRCAVDELEDSHIVIQYRAVFDNLEPIGNTLLALSRGEEVPAISHEGRHSATWGQPRLTDYLRWKATARKERRHARRITAVS